MIESKIMKIKLYNHYENNVNLKNHVITNEKHENNENHEIP